MTSPNYNDDPTYLASWILSAGKIKDFPFSEDELDVLNWCANQRYLGGPISSEKRYEIVILYWQMIGYLRKSD